MAKKKLFDSTTQERELKIFWDGIEAQINTMDVSKWEKFFGTVKTLNKTNKPMLDEAELRMTFDVLCENEVKRRGITKEEVIPSVSIESLKLMYIMKDNKRQYIANTENVCRILTRHKDFTGLLRYDEFKNTFEILASPDKNLSGEARRWRAQEDHDTIDIQTRIGVLLSPFARISKGMVQDAMMKVSKEHTVDTASDYMRGLVWDQTPRLDTWLTEVYGVEANEYHKQVGANWLKGLVKRIVFPGCKFDYVLVLEGEQGVKKSTSLAVLGDTWHTETTMSTDTKDFFMQFAGKAIIEFSEGETLSRTEVKRMKAIITMQSDRYRMPYERTTLDFPRRCVFAMTTNQTEYLKDETGNRRWLPVKVISEEANIAWLKENREQLFAEAYHRAVVMGETIYEFPKKETRDEQNKRMIHDPNEELVADWYFDQLNIIEREKGITIIQVYQECLHRNFATKPMSRYDEMQISDILTRHLKLRKIQNMRNGIRSTRFYPEVMSSPSELAEKMKEQENKLF